MKDILSTITAYREERGWTEYQLAERSGLPQSTISSWYRKNMVPTVASLEKYTETIRLLHQRLNEPFITVNSVTGDVGMQKAQEEYDRLIRNKTPKSRR